MHEVGFKDGLRQRKFEDNETSDSNNFKFKGKDLLHWRDMPRHLQFNPYIFTGYRPLLSIRGCIHSLFYIHNETINIITHGKKKILCVVNLFLLSFVLNLNELNNLTFVQNL